MSVTNQNKTMTDYKSYSLEQLENWIHDAITSGEASPHEIYSTIKKAVQEEYNIHKDLEQRCFGLLELLNGHRPVNFDDGEWTKEEVLTERDYYEPSMTPWGHSDLEYGVCYGSDPSPECKKAWDDFWKEMNTPASNKNNDVTKWVLPVEVDGASGEYYLTLPDDLLDGLGWKEGDTIEYIDNHNGTFSVKKVASKSVDE